jgi:hypothetical protein
VDRDEDVAADGAAVHAVDVAFGWTVLRAVDRDEDVAFGWAAVRVAGFAAVPAAGLAADVAAAPAAGLAGAREAVFAGGRAADLAAGRAAVLAAGEVAAPVTDRAVVLAAGRVTGSAVGCGSAGRSDWRAVCRPVRRAGPPVCACGMTPPIQLPCFTLVYPGSHAMFTRSR